MGLPAFELLLVLLLLVLPVTSPALAYASSPDPSRTYGIYDSADHDDVVVRVLSAAGNVAPGVLTDLLPILLLLGTLTWWTERVPITLSASVVRPRAPPASQPLFSLSSPVI